MKTCTKCGITKNLDEFSKSKRTDDGRRYDCRTCNSAANVIYRENNRRSLAASYAIYWDKNKSRLQAERAKQYLENKDKIIVERFVYQQKNKARRAAYRKNNSGKNRAYESARKARKLQASPPWADLRKIKEIYIEAGELREKSGGSYHVDHIIPLQGRTVCGLHVESNLQILTAHENQVKSNTLY